jgi:hypothetical protein
MREPSRPTVKRLFALSGNRCAFPKCGVPVVDPPSGSVLVEICHIQGENPGAARFDASQTDEERQAFENLILLCGIHHKVIDDDQESYTVERLRQIKTQQEAKLASSPATADDRPSRSSKASLKIASKGRDRAWSAPFCLKSASAGLSRKAA